MNTHKDISLAIVVSHPIQYWAPVYRQLSQVAGLKVKVFFVGENGARQYFDKQFEKEIKWDIPLTSGYEYEFLKPNFLLESYGFFSVDASNIVTKLEEFSPNFIWLYGYSQRINWRCFDKRLRGVKYIYTSDSNLRDTRSWWRNLIKYPIIKFFLTRCDVFLSCGQRNSEYLKYYGVHPKDIVDSVFPINVERLTKQASAISTSDRQALRDELGIEPDHSIILFAGKLIPHKRPQDIVELVSTLKDKKVSAVIVGSGEMKSKLEELALEKEVVSRVKFTGFVNQSGLAKYFNLADIFVFPSSKEPFGVIASEVLPFGLPIVAAEDIGAVGTSIVEGENAMLYSSGDIVKLAEQIEFLISNNEVYQRFSENSKALAHYQDKSVVVSQISKICMSGDLTKLNVQ